MRPILDLSSGRASGYRRPWGRPRGDVVLCGSLRVLNERSSGCGRAEKLTYSGATLVVEMDDKMPVPPLVGTGMVGAPVTPAAILPGDRCCDNRSCHRRQRAVSRRPELVEGGLQSGAVAADTGMFTQDRPDPVRFAVLAQAQPTGPPVRLGGRSRVRAVATRRPKTRP